MKKKILFPAAAACVYLLLLILLTLCERVQPGANIHNLADAFWYSIVTLTTVGYGDYYPVSAGGRLISLIFILMSAGLAAAVILAALSTVRGRLLPFLRLQSLRGKNCCLFSELNEESAALALDIAAQEPDARFLFFGVAEDAAHPYELPHAHTYLFSQHIAEAAGTVAGENGSTRVFMISDSISANLTGAQDLHALPVEIFCRGPETVAAPGVRFFDTPECCARMYWNRYPLSADEHRIVLVGDGRIAQALFSEAVLVNCRLPFAVDTYHLFGDWEKYGKLHRNLPQIFAMPSSGMRADPAAEAAPAAGEPTAAPAAPAAYDTPACAIRDTLVFHENEWYDEPDLFETQADRIIFCGDDASENAENTRLLARYFASSATIYTAAPEAALRGTKAISFGDVKELFTKEQVIRNKLDARAAALNEIYRTSVGGASSVWEELPPFLKASNRAAADHMITKLRILLPEKQPLVPDAKTCAEAAAVYEAAADKEPYRRNEHERWSRFLLMNNWRFGEKKDVVLRTHPFLTDYCLLPEKIRALDDSAWLQIGQLHEKMEDPS